MWGMIRAEEKEKHPVDLRPQISVKEKPCGLSSPDPPSFVSDSA